MQTTRKIFEPLAILRRPVTTLPSITDEASILLSDLSLSSLMSFQVFLGFCYFLLLNRTYLHIYIYRTYLHI
jgi:hypothetical protein